MLVSPSKLITNRIIKSRTINFETVQKLKGNLVFIPTINKDDMFNVLNGHLFRPTQLVSLFTPRRIRPLNRQIVAINQKEYYSDVREKTNGKIKRCKIDQGAYNGLNLVVDIFNEYTAERNAELTRFPSVGKVVQDRLTKYFENLIKKYTDSSEYEKAYIVFPMSAPYEAFKRKLYGTDLKFVDPLTMFIRSIKLGTIDYSAYEKVDKIIFYVPDSEFMVVMDLKSPDFLKDLDSIILKIMRLNSYNSGEDALDDIDDVSEEISEEDSIENTKEQIKEVILSKVAKTIRAANLTNFEAASKEERNIIQSIDAKVEEYLNRSDSTEKSFDELVAEVETDREVKLNAIRYIESKKANSFKADAIAKGLEKEIEVIGSLQDLDVDSEENVADKFTVNLTDIDSRVEESHLSSMDEEYNKKQFMKDLTNVISDFSDSEYIPMTVDNIEIVDSSDHQDVKKTMNVRYKTSEGKNLSFQIDVPEIVDKRYLFLGGNKKVIKKQLIRLPIVKIKPNTVEITTNFNKMTIERTNGKMSRKNLYLLKKLKEVQENPAIKIVYGSNSIVNSKMEYANDFEYEELADSLSRITTPKYDIIFNRDIIQEDIQILNIPEDIITDTRTPLGFEMLGEKHKSLVYIENSMIDKYIIESSEIEKTNKNMFEFLSQDVLNLNMSSLPSIGKSFIFTNVKFLATTYPILAVVASQNGLSDTLKRYKVEHHFSEKPIRNNIDYVEVKFKNKYLYYKDEIKNTLLMNAIYLMHTEKYDYEEFDTDQPYTDYFMEKLGDSVGIHTVKTLGVNLAVAIDPITRDVLRDMKLPTNVFDLLLYANTLLVGNQYRPLNDLTNYRVRSNELVADILYKIVADAYIKYQKHKMNGRPHNLIIPKNELIKRLLAEPNINDKSTLNPVLEAEQIAQASSKGFMGVNINKKVVSLYSDV